MTARGWTFFAVFVCLFIWAWVGLWASSGADFVGSGVAEGLALVCAAIGAGFGVWLALWTGRVVPAERLSRGMQNPGFRVVFLAAVLALMSLIEFNGVAWAFTAIFGEPGERTLTVSVWSSGGPRAGCSGPYFQEAPTMGQYCLDWSTWEPRMPKGSKLTVSGRASVLGMIIDHLVDLEPPDSAPATS